MPPRFLLVPDKFKGSLTAKQVAMVMQKAVLSVHPNASLTVLPITDGGEGFVSLMTAASRGKLFWRKTIDPLGRPCRARVAILPDGSGVVGLTEASGIWRLSAAERSAGMTTNLGSGILISRLAKQGCKRLLIGLGGSATTEGGIGLAIPSGFRFLNQNAKNIEPHGFGLADLSYILPPNDLPKIEVIAATDVDNPLYGPRGSAMVFAKQKGATSAEIQTLNRNLELLAEITQRDLQVNPCDQSGAGSAGGCGFGLMAFFGAKRESGFELFAQASQLDLLMTSHDIILTGEGCIDSSSLGGKGPIAVAAMAKAQNKTVWGFCGRYDASASLSEFFDFVDPISAVTLDAKKSIRFAARYLYELVRRRVQTGS